MRAAGPRRLPPRLVRCFAPFAAPAPKDGFDVDVDFVSAAGETPVSRDLKTDVAHSARMYDYYLGGKDNFAADREAAEKGSNAYLDADLSDPDSILAQAREVLDLKSPVALLLISVLQFLPGDDPYTIVAHLLSALPEGSYLVISHATADFLPAGTGLAGQRIYDAARIPLQLRTHAEIAKFFDGCNLVPPGLVPISEWHAANEPQARPTLADAALYCAVARITLQH